MKVYSLKSHLKTSKKPKEESDESEYKDVIKRQPARPGQKDIAEKILPFGQNNAFPLVLAQLVQESPTGSACISTYADFIEGGGFSDDTLSDLKINALGDTFGSFHAVNAHTYALFEGLAINVKYSGAGKITEIFNVPFENCRLGIPDENGFISKIRYNPYYGTSQFLRSLSIEYDVFNPDPKIVQKQMHDASIKKTMYQGQILYLAFTRPLSRFYPLPAYYSAEYWLKTDAQIGQFHTNNLKNGFYQSGMINMIGDPSAPSEHPDDFTFDETTGQRTPIVGRNRGTRFDEEMQRFTGSENAGNILVNWSPTKEQGMTFVAFPSQANTDFFKALQEQTTDSITRATKVPPSLANIRQNGLSSPGQEVQADVVLMQQRVAKTHSLLERTYKQILSNFATPVNSDVNIIHYNPFPDASKVDPLVWGALTVPEQRIWIKENTNYPVDLAQSPAPGVPPKPAVLPPKPIRQALFLDMSFTTYPEGAKNNAKTALRWREQNKITCGTPKGWDRAQNISEGKPLSYSDVKKIYNWLSKHEADSEKLLNDSCDAVLFKAWGGKEMLSWALSTKNTIEK